MNRDCTGFTLLELILVITLLGILAVGGIIKYMNIADSAKAGTRDSVVAAVQSGIKIIASRDITQGAPESYPASLDDAPDNTEASNAAPLFGDVLEVGVNQQWYKWSATCYSFTGKGSFGGATSSDYYKYTPSTGVFATSTAGCP